MYSVHDEISKSLRSHPRLRKSLGDVRAHISYNWSEWDGVGECEREVRTALVGDKVLEGRCKRRTGSQRRAAVEVPQLKV